jgi:hypothetical protein
MASHAHDHGLLLDPAALAYSWAEPDHIPPQLLVALGEYLSSSSCSSPSAEAEAESEVDDGFMMYEFKVRRCARARSHDWTACPYAHPGEAARRRDPRRVAYTGDPYPVWHQSIFEVFNKYVDFLNTEISNNFFVSKLKYPTKCVFLCM